MRLPHVLRPSDGHGSLSQSGRGRDAQPNTPPPPGSQSHTARMLERMPMTASLRHTPSLSSHPSSPSGKNISSVDIGSGTGSKSVSSSSSSGRHSRRPRTAPASRTGSSLNPFQSSSTTGGGRFTLKLSTTMDVLPAAFNASHDHSHTHNDSTASASSSITPARPPRSALRRSAANVPSSLSLSGYVADVSDPAILSTSAASGSSSVLTSTGTDDSSSTHSRPDTPILFAPLPSKQPPSPAPGAMTDGPGPGPAPFSRSTTPHNPLSYSVPRRSQSVDDLTNPVSPVSTLHPMTLSSLSPPNSAPLSVSGSAPAPEDEVEPAKPPVRDPRKWMTVDDLIDKALFLSISECDPSYLTHFLLCYRRITTPRALLLGMQRRLRFLDSQSSSDFLFTSFAQMRLCAFLARWMTSHPHDFAVRGTHGALKAFVSATLAKPHLLHYATVFRPFIERIEAMDDFHDDDADWAIKSEWPGTGEEGDDDSTLIPEEDEEAEEVVPDLKESGTPRGRREPSNSLSAAVAEEYKLPSMSISRPRTASMPLSLQPTLNTSSTAPTPTPPSLTSSNSNSTSNSNSHSSLIHKPASVPPRVLQDLLNVSARLNEVPVPELAEELSAMSTEHFLAVNPRDWVRAAFGLKRPSGSSSGASLSSGSAGAGGGKKGGDPVARLEGFANHIADWVASLVLAHDRPRSRAKQLAKFVDVAYAVRELGDYAMTRAFVAGITSAAPPGGPGRRELGRLYPDKLNRLKSLDILLARSKNFQAYRLALRNTEGPCVPAVGVHLTDLIGAGGNVDWAEEAPGVLAHWGKFAILGKIVDTLELCRKRTEAARERRGEEGGWVVRRELRDLVRNVGVLTPEMQFARSAQGGFDDEITPSGLTLGRTHSPEPSSRRSVFRQFFAR